MDDRAQCQEKSDAAIARDDDSPTPRRRIPVVEN